MRNSADSWLLLAPSEGACDFDGHWGYRWQSFAAARRHFELIAARDVPFMDPFPTILRDPDIIQNSADS